MEYIVISNDKVPAHKFKDKSQTKSLDEVRDFDNFGVIVPDGFVVLDFDTIDDAEIMLKIVKGLNLKTRVMKTTRGIHCWFKSSEPMKNFIKTRLANGITADCKSGVNKDKRAYVVVKQNGKMREFIRPEKLSDIQEIPAWLKPVSSPSKTFNFKGMGDGDGRNQELYNYIIYLQTKGFNVDQVKDTISVINRFVFKEPLPEYEINMILRDDAFLSEEEVEVELEKKGQSMDGFQHNVFADELVESFNLITVNEQMFVYEDGYYQQDERIVEQKMIQLYPAIKNHQRNEVLSYIKIQTHINSADLNINPYTINLKNTRLDVRTGDLLPFTPEAIEFDRIPVVYDPSAYNADLDKMLNRVFLNDKEVIKLFDEMVGYMLLKHNRYRSGFMLYGHGKNGKSTILNLIKAFIGERNYSTIELDKLADRFATAELEHKLVNIGDDINNRAIKDTGTIKKLFTGESVQVERKGERPFTLNSYAKMIFSMNEIPRSYDKSEGFYSRLIFIPFRAKFEATDPDFDPNIEDKIRTPEALSYLLNRALKGLQRLMKQDGFTQPKVVRQSMTDYRDENSIVRMWVKDESRDMKYILDTPRDELFSDFSDWCQRSGYKPLGKITFYKEIRQEFDVEDYQKRVDGETKWVFVVKI